MAHQQARVVTRQGHSRVKVETLAGVVLATGMAASALAFGGVTTLAFAPVQLAVAVTAMVVFWREGWPELSLGAKCVLGVLTAVPLLQLTPLPRAVVELLSGSRVALADKLPLAGQAGAEFLALTVNSFETRVALLRVICYALVFVLAMRLHRPGSSHRALLAVVFGLGLFEAVYGIIQYLTGWPYIFFYEKKFGLEQATGTYINRNHYAGLLEMLLPFVAARILVEGVEGAAGRRGAPLWRRLAVSASSSAMLRDGVVFALLALGLVFSGSRMGIAAAAVSLAFLAALAAFQGRRSAVWALAGVVALAAAYAWWSGVTPVVQRFEDLQQQGVSAEGRVRMWQDTGRLIADYPLLGTGLGTYKWASLHYQTYLLDYRYDSAHNDYLELAADMGIPAAALFWAGVWVLLVKVSGRALRLQSPQDRAVAMGCAGALLSLALHSLTDFNLQIPANAYLFAWVAGAAVALTAGRRGVRAEKESS